MKPPFLSSASSRRMGSSLSRHSLASRESEKVRSTKAHRGTITSCGARSIAGRCVGNHPSPCRLIRRASQSKETQHRLRYDAARQNDAQLGDQCAHDDVWEQVQLQDVYMGCRRNFWRQAHTPRCFALIDRTRGRCFIRGAKRQMPEAARSCQPRPTAQPYDDRGGPSGCSSAHEIDKGKNTPGGKTAPWKAPSNRWGRLKRQDRCVQRDLQRAPFHKRAAPVCSSHSVGPWAGGLGKGLGYS